MPTQLSLFERLTLEGVNATQSTTGCYDYVAEKTGLTSMDMNVKVRRGKYSVKDWPHKIRLCQQRLKAKGLIESKGMNVWYPTKKGKICLNEARTNKAKLYFVTSSGLAFWGDNSVASELFAGEVDLIVTSPPYFNQERSYQSLGETEHEYVDNLLRQIESILPVLKTGASLVLNLGHAMEKNKTGAESMYKELLLTALRYRLGLHLVQSFPWISLNKPVGGYYVTHKKQHLLRVYEMCYWFALDPLDTKADTNKIKVPYSEAWRKHLDAALRKSPTGKRLTRPSGHTVSDSYNKDNGGAIPSNVLFAVPESADSPYGDHCKENNIPIHPARMAPAIAEFFCEFLTDPGSVVMDQYSGSGMVPWKAETSNCHWISFEKTREYVDGHHGRFMAEKIPTKTSFN